MNFPPFRGSGDAFYCNDFTLSAPRPWKVPSRVIEVDSLEELDFLPEPLSSMDASNMEWDDLDPDGFAKVFGEINERINRGVIEKSVPVATETARMADGGDDSGKGSSGSSGCAGERVMSGMKKLGAPFYSYGWSDVDEHGKSRGFCGATPELLFELEGCRLNTMALAGTAKADELDVFSVDGKEIREHEFVAQTLVAKLSDIGQVTRGDRDIMDLGQLVHFHTSIEVELFEQREVDGVDSSITPDTCARAIA